MPKEDLKFCIDSLKKEQGEEGPVRVSYETLDAETAFYWRCLGEDFKSMAMDGEALLDELLPEVSGFCKYIQGYESQKSKLYLIYYYKIKTINFIIDCLIF